MLREGELPIFYRGQEDAPHTTERRPFYPTISLEDFAAQSNLPPEECANIYQSIIRSGLDPAHFYVVKNDNKYIVLAKYIFILSLVIKEIDYYNVDIAEHPIMGECAVATIKRTDFKEPFVWHFPLENYKTLYESNKYFMARKACLVQAIRLLFPDVFAQYNFNFYEESEIPSDNAKQKEEKKSYAISHNEPNYIVKNTSTSLEQQLEELQNQAKKFKISGVLVQQSAKTLFNKEYAELTIEQKIETLQKLLENYQK